MKLIVKIISTMAMTFLVVMSSALVASAAEFEIRGQVGSYYYNIIYDANGGQGSSMGPSIIQGGTHTVLPIEQTDITKDGYSFAGWNTDSEGTGTQHTAGDQLTLMNDDLVLYAQWQEVNSENDRSGGATVTQTTYVDSGTGSATVPKTGDAANIMMWMLLACVALGIMAVSFLLMRQRKQDGTHPQRVIETTKE